MHLNCDLYKNYQADWLLFEANLIDWFREMEGNQVTAIVKSRVPCLEKRNYSESRIEL